MELQYGPNKIWMENEAGTVVAEVDFVEREDGNYDIVHTFVDDSLRGQGAAGKLVKAAADEIRRRHKKNGHQLLLRRRLVPPSQRRTGFTWIIRTRIYSISCTFMIK